MKQLFIQSPSTKVYSRAKVFSLTLCSFCCVSASKVVIIRVTLFNEIQILKLLLLRTWGKKIPLLVTLYWTVVHSLTPPYTVGRGSQLGHNRHSGLIILCRGDCPAHCKVFSRIFCLYHQTSAVPPGRLWQLRPSPDVAKCPLSEKMTLIVNDLRFLVCFLLFM